MRFTQLRLVGFKSFVEATTLPIEPGLTGVVGPNGCGKSNLLEALRWVMGAASAKALRGEDMDDVIFGGSGERPARGHAEVTLSLETEGQAPEPFHAQPFLEVSRRIDRGAGSTYRINGSEVRARDVQLLFADGSTGANSPALVRQGQISELIAARPQNRRRILEEAAGVSGLHGRRHEAEIKVRAAEANLARLSDLEGELESSLARLRREARSAAKYKKIAAEIRGLRAAILHLAWRQAGETERAARAAVTEAAVAHEQAARAAAAASTEALKASEALAPLREEQAIAAAVHQRALLQQEQVDRDLGHAREAIARADEALRRLHADVAREEADTQQAGARIADLSARLAEVDAAVASFPDREPALAAALAEAERVRSEADGSLERYLGELASRQAHRKASRDRLAQVEASRAGVGTRLKAALAERDTASRGDRARLLAAEAEAESSALEVAAARKALEDAEAAFAAAERREAEARERTRTADSALQEIAVELKALSRATAADGADGAPTLLTSVSVDAGYEAALAAALRDELEAGLAPGGRPFWSELGIDSPSAPTWPEGVVSLAEHVRAPPRLARRLRFIGVVAEASAAERSASALAPGARLVSKGGGLWRWDGFVAPEGALLPAAVRLRDLARIEALSAAAAKAEPAAKIAKSEHAQAREALMRFERTRGDARRAIGPADTRERETRQRLDILQREEHRRLDRLSALREVIESLEADAARLAEEAQGLSDAAAPSPEDTAFEAQAPALRATVAEARRGEAEARVAVERHASERHQLERRRIQLIDDLAGWERRAAEAKVRLDDLAGARPTLEAELVRAKAAPEAIEAERRRLLDTLEIGEARRRAADDALTLADTARREAEQAARAAETRAASAGEARAGADARLEAAAERTAQAALDVREATDLEPAALETWLGDQAIATPTDLAGARAHLAALEREQAGVGPVNLLAEEEAEGVAARLEEMRRERDDLTGALSRLRRAIGELNAEARERLRAAFVVIDERFRDLFTTLFEGGAAELRLVDSEDPLEAGLEILACPPGKRMSVMSLMSGGEQALTAAALIFAVFLANPAPICVLDEVDAPLDDANVERFCNLLDEMRRRTATRFLTITHNPLTMSRMDRLFGVTMRERGVSQLVSVDLRGAEALRAA